MKKQMQEYAIIDIGDGDELFAVEADRYEAEDLGCVVGHVELDITGEWIPGSPQDLALSLREKALRKWRETQ
jgi:hypothetical protein